MHRQPIDMSLKMDRCRVSEGQWNVVRQSILSHENVGWALWVLVEFHLLWIESDVRILQWF